MYGFRVKGRNKILPIYDIKLFLHISNLLSFLNRKSISGFIVYLSYKHTISYKKVKI